MPSSSRARSRSRADLLQCGICLSTPRTVVTCVGCHNMFCFECVAPTDATPYRLVRACPYRCALDTGLWYKRNESTQRIIDFETFAPLQDIPHPWGAKRSLSHGIVYYWNPLTKTSQWERPNPPSSSEDISFT
jgi:hypothetical protein